MSGLYLFCITGQGDNSGLDVADVGGHSVSCLSVAGLAVWAEASAGAPRVSAQAIARHDAVVRAVWAATEACLPLRFGQWVADAATLEERLTPQRAALERALARVSGAGEHGIRIGERAGEPSQPPPLARESGRAYLEALRLRASLEDAHRSRAEAVAAELEARTAGVVRAQRCDVLRPERGLLSVAHLVARERETAYASSVRAYRDDHPELAMVTTGPWPPYSFGP